MKKKTPTINSPLEITTTNPVVLKFQEESTEAPPAQPKARLDKRIHAGPIMARIPYNIHAGFIPFNLLDNPDPVMQLEGGKGPAIYEDMTLDPVIDAGWTKILNTITGMDWEVLASSDSAEDVRNRDFINDAFLNMNATLWAGNRYMGGLSAVLAYITDGIRMGYSIPEAIWNLSEGRIVQINQHIPQAFTFMNGTEAEKAGAATAQNYGFYGGGVKPYFSAQWTAQDLFYRPAPAEQWTQAPPYKFIHCVFRPQYNDPWGRSQFRGAYWPYIFGFLDCLKWWSIFLDKWASPSIAYLADQLNWEDDTFVTEILAAISNMQQSYAAVLPQNKNGGDNLKVIETNRSSTHSVFKDFFDTMNRLKCMALVGSPLLMMESEFGTRAQAQTQAQYIHQDFIKGFCDYVMANVAIPIQWMIDVRYGRKVDMKYPTFKLKYEELPDLKQELEIDSGLQKMGAKFTVEDIEQRYNRQFAKPDEETGEMPEIMEPAPPPNPFGAGAPPNGKEEDAEEIAAAADDDFITSADLPKYKELVLRKGGIDVQKFLRKKKKKLAEKKQIYSPIRLHGEHDQSTHGSWAHGGGYASYDRAAQNHDQRIRDLEREGAKKIAGYSDRARIDREGVIHTDDVDDAVFALHEGKKVELYQPRQVSTLLDRLRQVSAQMIEKGGKAPNFNLCNVSVKGTNLFCAGNLEIDRIKMPQIDDPDKFLAGLKDRGISVETGTTESAAYLRATQNQLRSDQVSGIATAMQKDPKLLTDKPIFISKEGYVLDGHHRWAAAIGLDTIDGHLGDVQVPVIRVDLSIVPLLDIANQYSGERAGMDTTASKPQKFSEIFRLKEDAVVLRAWLGSTDGIVGAAFTDPDYVFATQNPEIIKAAGGIPAKIKVPAGTQFALAENKSEIVLNRNTKFRINKVSANGIEMEVLR